MRVFLCVLMSLCVCEANAGVGQGNPSRTKFYNLKLGYTIQTQRPHAFQFAGSADVIKIGPLLHLKSHDTFYVSESSQAKSIAGSRCEESALETMNLVLTWIGKDCGNPEVRALFEDLRMSVKKTNFQ